MLGLLLVPGAQDPSQRIKNILCRMIQNIIMSNLEFTPGAQDPPQRIQRYYL